MIKKKSFSVSIFMLFNVLVFNAHANPLSPVVLGITDFYANPIKVCLDNNFWYPYVFLYKKKPVGLHVEMVHKALKDLKIPTDYYPKTWGQCLKEVESGQMDAILSVSFTEDRDNFIYFPDDAANQGMSDWRLAHVSYHVLTIKNQFPSNKEYYFQGNLKTLPKPVRVEADYSVAQRFLSENIDVVYGNSVIDNIKQMLLYHEGSVITTKEVADSLLKKAQFKNKYILHKKPIYEKSYFIGFSKKGRVPRRLQRKIWMAVKSLRTDDSYRKDLNKKYGY